MRFYEKCQCVGQKKLYRSILKHGWLNHKFEIIELCEESRLNELEIFYIRVYNSVRDGLNIKHGGNGGGRLSEDTKILIGRANAGIRGRKRPAEVGLKISLGKIGKKRTVKMRLRMRDIQSKIKRSGRDSPFAKRVTQLDLSGNTIREWDSIADAAREYGFGAVGATGISKCCRGLLKSYKGFKWRFIEKTINLFYIPTYKIKTNKFDHILHGKIVSGFETNVCEYVGAKYGVGVSSATMAIFLCLVGSSTEITIPSIIPPVVPNAILNAGCSLKFNDNIDWVGDSYILHDFDSYKIIDSAQKISIGQFAEEGNDDDLMIFSFYPTKPIGSCDGGLIVSNNKDKIDKIRTLAYNGWSNPVDRDLRAVGYKAYLNSIQAYIANMNFFKLDEKYRRLSEIRDRYNDAFGLNNHSNHLYRIEVINNKDFCEAAKKEKIVCGIHYLAAHHNPIYNNTNLVLPRSERASLTTVSIPFHEKMKDEDVDRVIRFVNQYGNKV